MVCYTFPMNFEPFTPADLPALERLKPVDWSDILTPHLWYLSTKHCYPHKVMLDGIVVGIGTAIHMGQTGWLGHIIVDPSYRGRGIGRFIVVNLKRLLLDEFRCKTISLLATDLGFPVYVKEGFTSQAEYAICMREKQIPSREQSNPHLRKFSSEFEQQVLMLDTEISGEHRTEFIQGKLAGADLYCENDELHGFHLGAFGEGLIFATHERAGLALLGLRIQQVNRLYVPAKNVAALSFLKQNNFQEVKRLNRMILGEPFAWKSECVFNRAAGYLG